MRQTWHHQLVPATAQPRAEVVKPLGGRECIMVRQPSEEPAPHVLGDGLDITYRGPVVGGDAAPAWPTGAGRRRTESITSSRRSRSAACGLRPWSPSLAAGGPSARPALAQGATSLRAPSAVRRAGARSGQDAPGQYRA